MLRNRHHWLDLDCFSESRKNYSFLCFSLLSVEQIVVFHQGDVSFQCFVSSSCDTGFNVARDERSTYVLISYYPYKYKCERGLRTTPFQQFVKLQSSKLSKEWKRF